MKIKTSIKILLASIFAIPLIAYAYTVSISAIDGGGTVTFNTSTGGIISGSQAGLSNVFIRANPDSGKTFSSWTGTLAGYPPTINTTIASNISSVAQFSNAPTAIMSINNKCVSRIVTFTATTARPENGVQKTVTKVQIYVLENSSFNFSVQDTSGYLASSPNQAFYYAYNAGTVGAGTYLGSNAAFVGASSYLSMGSATNVTDVRYSCASPVTTYTVTFKNNLPGGVTTSMTGAGTYNNHTRVILTAGTPTNYKLQSFSGQCGGGLNGSGTGGYAFLTPISGNSSSNSYVIDDLVANCEVNANYLYVPPATNQKFTITLTADPNGSVTINGNTGGVVSYVATPGQALTISATPASGYRFGGWSDFFTGYSSSFTWSADRNVNALASFVASTTVTGTANDGNTANTLNIQANVSNGGFLLYNNFSRSFPSTLQDVLGGNWYNNSTVTSAPNNWVVANDGFRFTGWTGNIGTSTLAKINAGTNFSMGEINGISNATIIANFTFDGTEQTNGGTQFSETIATNPTTNSYITEDVLTSYVNSDGSWNVSPYTIDSQCVRQVVTITGKRANNSISAFFTGASTYSLYFLNGSDVSLTRQGNFITFKSDPSNIILRASDSPLPGGQFSSTQSADGFGAQPIFSAVDQLFTFRIDPDTTWLQESKGFSCSAGQTDSGTYAPLYSGSHYLLEASLDSYANFAVFGTNNLVTTLAFLNGTSTDAYRTITTGYDYDRKHTFRRVDCNTATLGLNNVGMYCASAFTAFPRFSNTVSWDDYGYIWVFTTKPVKAFYHQQISNPEAVYKNGANREYGLIYFPADKQVLVTGSSTVSAESFTNEQLYTSTSTSNINRASLPLYATRINLNTCRWYYNARRLNDGNAYEACSKIPYYDTTSNTYTSLGTNIWRALYQDTLNGYFMDVSKSYTGQYLYYGSFFTSSGQFDVKEGADPVKMFKNLPTQDPLLTLDINPPFATSSVILVDYGNYIATSTTPGYYDAPVYHATTTNSISGCTGTANLSGGYALCYATTSVTLTPNGSFNASMLLIGGGATGYNGSTYSWGNGGSAGEYSYTATTSLTNTGLSAVIGLGATTSDTNGATSTFNGITAKGGRSPSNGHISGNNYAGGTANGGGGGGGGSSGVGSNGCNGGGCGQQYKGGDGGPGTANSITGSSVTYACGGGGDGYANAGAPAGTRPCSTYGSGGSAGGSSGTWTVAVNGVLILKYATTTPGYYDAPVYHATTTNPGYYATTTATTYTPASTTPAYRYGKLFEFGADTYAAKLNTTSIGYTSFAQMQTSLESRYSLASCSVTTLNFIGNLLCLVKNSFINTFLWLFLPSADQFRSFNLETNAMVERTNSPVSLIFTIPLRFASYGDLTWTPSTSTPLTLGFSTSTKVTFLNPATSTTVLYSNSDFMISSWLEILFSLVLVIMVSMMALRLIL